MNLKLILIVPEQAIELNVGKLLEVKSIDRELGMIEVETEVDQFFTDLILVNKPKLTN